MTRDEMLHVLEQRLSGLADLLELVGPTDYYTADAKQAEDTQYKEGFRAAYTVLLLDLIGYCAKPRGGAGASDPAAMCGGLSDAVAAREAVEGVDV